MSHSMIPADWGPVHPLQPRERESRVAKARKTMTVEVTGMYTSEAAVNATELLRWEATLRQLEEGLAAVTAERDDLEGLVTALQSEETIATTELVQVNRALAQVESADNAALAEMTRERDVYKRVADILSTYGTRESAVLSYRAHAAEARRSDAPNKRRVSQHYEALAEALAELPSLDLIPEVML